MEIIDTQMEVLFPDESLPPEVTPWPTLAARLAVLSEAGIARSVACRTTGCADADGKALRALNRRIAETCNSSSGRLIPSAVINPVLDKQDIRSLVCFCATDLGMRVAGVMPADEPDCEAGNLLYWDALERLMSHRMIPILHCRATTADKLAERCPEGRAIIGGEFDEFYDKLDILASRPNLYLLISGYRIALTSRIREAADRLGAERLVFGSGLGRVDPMVAVECVKRSRLDEDEQRLLLAGSFETLLAWAQE